MLTRVASSHLRVGSFQYAAALGDYELVQRLADQAISRHYPSAAHAEHPYRALFAAVVAAQASLVARWMLAGFIHGVMNTDNMTISGETIDYGPCAFLDAFDPATVFSSIDHAVVRGWQPGGGQRRVTHNVRRDRGRPRKPNRRTRNRNGHQHRQEQWRSFGAPVYLSLDDLAARYLFDRWQCGQPGLHAVPTVVPVQV